MNNQKIEWLGHASWKYTTPNGTVIYVDPWIKGNPSCKISISEATDADLVLVTHGHNDHIGNSIEICKTSGAALVTIPDVCAYAALHGIPYDDRGGAVHVGGSVVIGDCTIRSVFALHYSDIWGKEYDQTGVVVAGSGCCGFIVEPENGESVYFAGDTGLFGDMKLLGEIYRPYVSVLPVGDKYVMGINEAAYAAAMLGSKYILPGHYNTFANNPADIEVFKVLVKARAPFSEAINLPVGEQFVF